MDPTLQDNVLLLPADAYIYHIGNAHDMRSIIRRGSILGGCLIRDRQPVFFTAVNPMYTHQHKERRSSIQSG